MKKILAPLLALILLSSCQYGKFLNSKNHTGDLAVLISQQNEPHLLTFDDKITVSVWDHDNISLGSIFSIYSSHETFGKWVLIDSAGYAKLPKVGEIKLGGLTCDEASDLITEMYRDFLVEPIIVVKVLNREVTVIGEVKTPGNYLMDKENTTLYEIIGKSEGFLQYSNTKDIQLIRNNVIYHIDLSQDNGLALHTIRVQGKDLINVPAMKGKNFDLVIKRIIPFSSAITAIAVFTTLLK